jgi:hypothetical protein
MSKSYPNHKWVVYTSRLNRTDIGVYERFTEIVGDHAYVRRDSQGSNADILPTGNVFETKDEAIGYLAGKGVKRWVVSTGDWSSTPCVLPFLGLVTFGLTQRHGRFDRIVTAVRLSDGKAFSGDRDLATFDTKKAAEKYHATIWRRRIIEIKKGYAEKHALLNGMYENAPRSRKKGRT